MQYIGSVSFIEPLYWQADITYLAPEGIFPSNASHIFWSRVVWSHVLFTSRALNMCPIFMQHGLYSLLWNLFVPGAAEQYDVFEKRNFTLVRCFWSGKWTTLISVVIYFLQMHMKLYRYISPTSFLLLARPSC